MTNIYLLFLFLFIFSHADESAQNADVEPEYQIPNPQGIHFVETFQDGLGRWKESSKEKFTGEWRVGTVENNPRFSVEQGLIVSKKAQHHAISTKFDKPIGGVKGKDLVIQYEVRFHQNHECGGAYIKLLSEDKKFKPEEFDNETPYTIMFGPDKCGTNDKVHFIFRHQSPKTKKWEEKHLRSPPQIKNDKLTHLYTLVIRKDDTYEIFIDQKSAKSGSLFSDFDPAIDPPQEIDDPTDSKPADWVDQEKIKDPEAKKPEDWDESAPATIPDEDARKPTEWCDDCPTMIPDPDSQKPDDWDDEVDGEWTAPTITNPKCEEVGCGEWTRPNKANPNYKGKWIHPMISNPAYKGPWKARQIANPDYFHDEHPHVLNPIGGIGIEIWTMQDDIEFDNILVDNSEDAASEFGAQTWGKKNTYERAKGVDSSGDSEEGIVGQVKQFVAEKPGIFVAIIVGVVTLLMLLIFWCCSGGAPEPRPHRHQHETKETKDAKDTKAPSTEQKQGTTTTTTTTTQQTETAETEPKDKEPKDKETTVKRKKEKTSNK